MVDQYIFSGSLPENASTYVTREADTQLYEGLKAGKFCYVLNSRQSGKSSLRVRTMQRLREDGVQCAAIDLSSGGIQNVLPEQWYADLIDTLIDTFGLDVDFGDWWLENQLNTLVTRFRKFLEEILLVEVKENIVIFIDEIDSILSLNFPTDDFFALIRACYNKRVDNPDYNRLTFCLLGVASPSNLIEDKQRTPFNIGQAISLKGFQLHEVEPLEKGLYDQFSNPQAIMQEILQWTGGQPFLTQKLCQFMVEESTQENPRSVEQVVRSRIIENWESQDEPEHLRTIRNRIFFHEHQAVHLLELYQYILEHCELSFENTSGQEELLLTGLIVNSDNNLKVNNKIYKYIFNLNWVDQELANVRPYSEALKAWLASDCKNNSFLLKADALERAINWLFERSFFSQDYRFVLASQELEAKEIKNAYKALEEAQKKVEIAQEEQIEAIIKLIELERNKTLIDSNLDINISKNNLLLSTENTKTIINNKKFTKKTNIFLKTSFMFMAAIVSLTSITGHKLYNQPQLKVGTIAPHTIKAPYTAKLEDQQQTTAKRQAISKYSWPILMVDGKINESISHNLQQLLDDGSKIRSNAGSFFYTSVDSSKDVYSKTILLDLSDDDWAKIQTGIRQISARILTQGIPYGLPANALKDTVGLQVQTLEPPEAQPLATKVLLAVLQPNIKKDEVKTQEQAEKAVQEILPVVVEVRQDQVIVTKGQKISQWNLQVLQHYQLIERETNWAELLKLTGIVTTAIGIFVGVERRLGSQLRQRDRLLILLLTLSTPGLITLGVSHTTWSAIGLLLGSFYGPALGVTVVGLMLLVLPISMEISTIALIAGAAGGIVGSLMAKRLRSREELALLGLAIASTQGGIYLILSLFWSPISWYVILKDAGLFALWGLAWSVVALGLSPYLEKIFDLVTPIRLAELANPNCPLLKRLATETPGTFQHTLLVSTLAEAAAKKLRCNFELVRAGSMYHDIGKMHDPLGFVENQMGGANKHETEINDPWKSVEIIKKHVSEGLVLARKHLLPTAIQAFIPEAKGTMLISNFYYQAQQLAKEASGSIIVNEVYFRYDGPIPQSRETGIVMLAARCAGELKSLKNITSEQAFRLVKTILRVQWQGNQLMESGLTKEEVDQIAHIFVEVWLQMWSSYHVRKMVR